MGDGGGDTAKHFSGRRLAHSGRLKHQSKSALGLSRRVISTGLTLSDEEGPRSKSDSQSTNNSTPEHGRGSVRGSLLGDDELRLSTSRLRRSFSAGETKSDSNRELGGGAAAGGTKEEHGTGNGGSRGNETIIEMAKQRRSAGGGEMMPRDASPLGKKEGVV